MSTGLERIASILAAARRRGEKIGALLVPKNVSRKLADELFEVEGFVASAIPSLDCLTRGVAEREVRQRERYLGYVEEGGFVGEIYGIPMLVWDDCVICVLNPDELEEYAEANGIDVSGFC